MLGPRFFVSVIALIAASSLVPSKAFVSPSRRVGWSQQQSSQRETMDLFRPFNNFSVRKPLSSVALDETDEMMATNSDMSLEVDKPLAQFQQQQQQQLSTTMSNWAGMDQQELISRAINGVFLAASLGCAVYAILNINQGMTRGWTQSEIAMRIPLDTWSSYETALESSPIATKTMINVIIYLLGDWLSQTVFAKQHILDFDLGRTLRNGFIGLCFGPLVHEYYQFSDAILPVEGGLANRVMKIFMDQTIYLSVKCSMYIMAVNTLQGESLETSTTAVKEKIGGIVLTAWKFWPLIHCITYSVIPARHRILWVNCVDLVWNAILASMSQKTKPEDETDSLIATETERQFVAEPEFSAVFSRSNFETNDFMPSGTVTSEPTWSELRNATQAVH